MKICMENSRDNYDNIYRGSFYSIGGPIMIIFHMPFVMNQRVYLYPKIHPLAVLQRESWRTRGAPRVLMLKRLCAYENVCVYIIML